MDHYYAVPTHRSYYGDISQDELDPVVERICESLDAEGYVLWGTVNRSTDCEQFIYTLPGVEIQVRPGRQIRVSDAKDREMECREIDLSRFI